MRSSALLSLSCLALLGLALPAIAADEPTEEEKTTAELRMYASMSGLNASSFFDAYDSEACEAGKGRLATFNALTRGEKKERLPGGTKRFILGVGHVTPGSGEQAIRNACRAMYSFTPENMHSYEIRQDMTQRNCPISIKDATTGTEVKADRVKPGKACKEKK
jgi:hypothetical protein